MKKLLLLMTFLSIAGIVTAQVGINTQNPQGIIHIHPDGSIPLSNTDDDIIVSKSGNIGIGTTPSTIKLDIKTKGTSTAPIPAFTLQDGNEGDGKALITNANGLATWKALTYSEAVQYVRVTTAPNLSLSTNNYYKSGSYIDLPAGRWVIMAVLYMPITNATGIDAFIKVHVSFADNTTVANNGQVLNNIATPDLEGSKSAPMYISRTNYFNIFTAAYIIHNRTTASKRYHLMLGQTSYSGTVPVNAEFNQPGGPWGEDTIVAYRIPSDL